MDPIPTLIKFHQQLRVFHWQTTSFAQHKAFGEIYDELNDIIDEFVETFTGKYGRNQANLRMEITLTSLSEEVLPRYLDAFTSFLESMDKEIDDTSILNIRDEMLGQVNKLRYLLTIN